MKVLYIVSTLGRTGPTNQLYYIIKNLDREYFNPVILTLSPESSHSQKQKFDQLGIEIHTLGLSRIQGLLKGGRELKKTVNNIKPDIVHTQGLRADELAAKYLQNFNHVASIRNYPFHDYPMKFGKTMGSWMAQKHFSVIKQIKNPIACSNTIQRVFKEKHNLQIGVVQNGVDTSRFCQTNEEQKKKLRAKLNLPLDTHIFISVGSLIQRKDPGVVIQSFLKAKTENSILLMVGDGPLLDECKQVVDQIKNVIFTGSISNVNEYLMASDYFISASLSEGLPNTVLEALATGLPVILSDIDSHEEIVNMNPIAGKLIPVKDIDGFAKGITDIRDLEQLDMKDAALKIIYQHLDAKIMSSKYQQIYKKLESGS